VDSGYQHTFTFYAMKRKRSNSARLTTQLDQNDKPAAQPKSLRVRSFSHVDGNWPCHVYVSVQRDTCAALQRRACLLLKEEAETVFPQEELHISLSRAFTLREHQLESFRRDIKEALGNISSFQITFDSECIVFPNDERTTSFACALVEVGKEAICDVIQKVNQVMHAYSKRTYYKDPKPHVSLAWTPGNVTCKRKKSLVPYLSSSSSSEGDDDADCAFGQDMFLVRLVHMKAGNRSFIFRLAAP